jgi:hypothetical protein
MIGSIISISANRWPSSIEVSKSITDLNVAAGGFTATFTVPSEVSTITFYD